MSLATNIIRRGRSRFYYVRIAVPKPLQAAVGKEEIWKSLRTSDPTKARVLSHSVIEKLRAEWETLAQTRALQSADIEEAIWDRYNRIVEDDEKFRANLASDDDLEEIWRELHREFGDHDIAAFRIYESIKNLFEDAQTDRADRLATLKGQVARGKTESVADLVKAELAKRRLEASSAADVKRLAHGLQRAEIEGLSRAVERDAGDFSGSPKDAIVRPPVSKRPAVVAPTETIMGVFARFERERAGSMSPDTMNQCRTIMQLFAEFAGPSVHVSVITRKTARDWKEKLFQWPIKASQIREFQGLGFSEVIDRNITLNKPTISQKTINKYLSALGSFARFLLANGFIEVDLMAGMFLELDRSKRMVFPFSNEQQLTALFNSPLYVGCRGDGFESEPGNVAVRDWRYWIPLISLYTGARLGEIAQLHVADVKSIHDCWCIHITTEGGEEKSLKTLGSARVVPLHAELIRIGLIDYHAAMTAQGKVRLFPEIVADKRGFVSGVPSKWFNTYLRKIGVKSDRTQNFHSLRHGIVDAFRTAGFLDEQFGVLLGHTKASTTQRYGVLSQGNLATRRTMIDAVEFPGLSLAHLSGS